MTRAADLLLPRPSRLEETGETCILEGGCEIVYSGPAEGEAVRERLTSMFASRGLGTPDEGSPQRKPFVRLAIGDAHGMPTQAYRLCIAPTGIEVEAAAAAGLHYGVLTLVQWIDLHRSREPEPPRSAPSPVRAVRLAGIAVLDAPDFAHRGVLLDVSRNRVPTMETLFRLVDLFSSWKINQLQLYTEHTFAYEGHEEVWRNATPLTAAEVRRLDNYCRERFVELVPNQNSFGHFHRWLVHPRYRPLAECPDGVKHPFSARREPFSLCPVDPAALDLLADLYSQLLPNFSSGLFNVGFDETFDLGKGRSAEACGEAGREDVYVDFLSRVRELASSYGKRVQFWADIARDSSEIRAKLPRDAIALEWGYEADHPFALNAATLAEAGLDFYVCPGTSSWNSFAGRTRNAVLNLAGAALAGVGAGALGYMVADWGDSGHLQPLPVSYPGFLAGAAFGWNAELAKEPMALDLPALLERHVFEGSGELARAVVDLGNAYLDTRARPLNGTVLFRLLAEPWDDLDHPRYEKVTADGLERVSDRVRKIRRDLADYVPRTPEQRLARLELVWVADALAAAARFGLSRLKAGRSIAIEDLPRSVRRATDIDVDSLSHSLPGLWTARSREGGLADSQAVLNKARRG